ncbi:MAG: amidohydrolase family protein [Parvibaculaceae bacterium]
MPSSLVHGRHVVCHARNGDAPLVIEDGAVFQRDGRIVEVGKRDALMRHHAPDEVIGGPDKIVLPGLVNAHHHVGLTPFQLGSTDLPLEQWIVSRLGARDVDLHLDTLYAAFQMVESGITTVQHLHGWVPGSVPTVLESSRAVMDAYARVGMRCSYSYLARDQCRLVYEDDATFIATLPEGLRTDATEYVRQRTLSITEILELSQALLENTPARRPVRVQLAPANLHWCSDALLGKLRDLSRKHDLPMHMHILESPYQKEYARRRSGSAIGHLKDLGLLGRNLTLGHAVWTTEAEIEEIAASGTCICHNCSSNFRLRSGIAPLQAFLDHGITVGLGIDEAGINDDRDMLQEMRVVRLAHRMPGHDEGTVTPARIFHMASEGSAETTPFRGEIGVLEEGRAADIVVMNWKDVAEPYLEDGVPVVDALVYRARSNGVETVIVEGECIYRDGRFMRIDKEAAMAELKARLAHPPSADDVRRRTFSQALWPHALDFYRNYLPDGQEGRTFYHPNGRD